ncbi:MAG: hypothetical protein HY432_01760 [Candidatus Liptonbacteria bacterium]|nr:hypothetical protein [Candidatus Liptonbacteria bacterium]
MDKLLLFYLPRIGAWLFDFNEGMRIRTATFSLAAAIMIMLGGCAGTITYEGKPWLGFESEKDKEGRPVPAFGSVVTVHNYNYRTQPAPTPPGTPPSPPGALPPQADSPAAVPSPGRTYVAAASGMDYGLANDPTVVTFVNESPNVVRIQIRGQPEIRLLPYQSSADIAFFPGEYSVKVTREQPTSNFGGLQTVRVVTFSVSIRGNGGWQIINVGIGSGY